MHIVSASKHCTGWIWNAATGECEAELKGHSKNISSAVFSPDGMHIVSASDDITAWVWNTATGRCERTLRGGFGSGHVTSVIFSSDSMHIVSVFKSSTV